jgi:hypothetical protein
MKRKFNEGINHLQKPILKVVSVCILMICALTNTLAQTECGCDHVIRHTDPVTLGKIYKDGAAMGVQPGDKVCIMAGIYTTRLELERFNGDANNPVLIVNCGGQVIVRNSNANNPAINILESTHFKISGKGNAGFTYGIKIENSAQNGLAIGDYSSYQEVEGFEIMNTGFAGIISKTEPDCDHRDLPSFVQRNSKFHDNYIHDTGGEGFYVGFTAYPNGKTINCGGVSVTVLPHRLENVEIYNNRVEHTGWDGIQLNATTVGGKIYGNTIIDYANDAAGTTHLHGIQLSNDIVCSVYNNKILPTTPSARSGPGNGIASWAAEAKIFNNIIVNPGNLGSGKNGIQFYGSENPISGASHYVINNTIINPARACISMFHSNTNNKFNNNILVAASEFIIDTKPPATDTSYNFRTTSIDYPKFVNHSTFDYHLTSESPCIGAGVNRYAEGVTFDLDNKPRPSSGNFDQGAYLYTTNPGGGTGDDSWLELTSNNAAGDRVEFYSTSAKSNSVQQQVRTGGNDVLQFYLKPITGTPNWANMQIGMTVSFQNRYVNLLSTYFKETNAEGWTRIAIPVADFLHDAASWTNGGVSNIGVKIISGFASGTTVFGIDEIQFVGSANPYTWYGDSFEASGEDTHVLTSDAVAFKISNRWPTGGVAGSESTAGWLRLRSETGAAGKRIEVYYDAQKSNSVQKDVRASGNDKLQLYLKPLSGTPTWGSFQIGFTVKFQTRYLNVTSTYIKETTDGWMRVEMPLADFLHDADRWVDGGVSNIHLKIISGFATTAVEFGVDEIQFVGGTTPFVWYGDQYTISGEATSVAEIDPAIFYILERPTTGGAPTDSSGGSLMAPGGGEEPTETFHISIYDGFGQYIKSFQHRAKVSELDLLNFRPYVNQKGMYLFRITRKDGTVTSERIVFTN